MNNLMETYQKALDSNLDLVSGMDDEILVRESAQKAICALEKKHYIDAIELSKICSTIEAKHFRDGPWHEFFQSMLIHVWEIFMEENYLERQKNTTA